MLSLAVPALMFIAPIALVPALITNSAASYYGSRPGNCGALCFMIVYIFASFRLPGH
jgi:hypothetical protein